MKTPPDGGIWMPDTGIFAVFATGMAAREILKILSRIAFSLSSPFTRFDQIAAKTSVETDISRTKISYIALHYR
jgi:hypothetical protein